MAYKRKQENLVENGQNCTATCKNSDIPLDEKYRMFFCSDCPFSPTTDDEVTCDNV